MELHPQEIEILKVLNEKTSPEIVSEKSGLDPNAVMRASSWLSTKNLIKIQRVIGEEISLDSEGKTYSEFGLPERKIIDLISDSLSDLI